MNAMYIGSFDPFTLGHLGVIKQVLDLTTKTCTYGETKIFPTYDKLIICVGKNNTKTPMFTAEKRKRFIDLAVKDCLVPKTSQSSPATNLPLTLPAKTISTLLFAAFGLKQTCTMKNNYP